MLLRLDKLTASRVDIYLEKRSRIIGSSKGNGVPLNRNTLEQRPLVEYVGKTRSIKCQSGIFEE